MEIIKNFGFDPILFVAQIINFLIVLYILKRFLYKPILTTLKKRQETIKLSLKQAEESRKLLEQASEKERTILKNAQAQTAKMIEATKKDAQKLAKQMEEDAKQRSEKMLLEAKQTIAQEFEKMEKRVSKHVSELAITFLEHSLSGLFTDREQKEVMQKAIKQLKKAD